MVVASVERRVARPLCWSRFPPGRLHSRFRPPRPRESVARRACAAARRVTDCSYHQLAAARAPSLAGSRAGSSARKHSSLPSDYSLPASSWPDRHITTRDSASGVAREQAAVSELVSPTATVLAPVARTASECVPSGRRAGRNSSRRASWRARNQRMTLTCIAGLGLIALAKAARGRRLDQQTSSPRPSSAAGARSWAAELAPETGGSARRRAGAGAAIRPSESPSGRR